MMVRDVPLDSRCLVTRFGGSRRQASLDDFDFVYRWRVGIRQRRLFVRCCTLWCARVVLDVGTILRKHRCVLSVSLHGPLCYLSIFFFLIFNFGILVPKIDE